MSGCGLPGDVQGTQSFTELKETFFPSALSFSSQLLQCTVGSGCGLKDHTGRGQQGFVPCEYRQFRALSVTPALPGQTPLPPVTEAGAETPRLPSCSPFPVWVPTPPYLLEEQIALDSFSSIFSRETLILQEEGSAQLLSVACWGLASHPRDASCPAGPSSPGARCRRQPWHAALPMRLGELVQPGETL